MNTALKSHGATELREELEGKTRQLHAVRRNRQEIEALEASLAQSALNLRERVMRIEAGKGDVPESTYRYSQSDDCSF